LAWLYDCAAFQHLAATFMREVAAGQFSVVRTLCLHFDLAATFMKEVPAGHLSVTVAQTT